MKMKDAIFFCTLYGIKSAAILDFKGFFLSTEHYKLAAQVILKSRLDYL